MVAGVSSYKQNSHKVSFQLEVGVLKSPFLSDPHLSIKLNVLLHSSTAPQTVKVSRHLDYQHLLISSTVYE